MKASLLLSVLWLFSPLFFLHATEEKPVFKFLDDTLK